MGQVLYLEAEAAGLRGTGIGCYFDDDCHELLGLQLHGTTSQSFYHFTVDYQLVDGHRRYPDHLALLEGAESAPRYPKPLLRILIMDENLIQWETRVVSYLLVAPGGHFQRLAIVQIRTHHLQAQR